MNGGIECELDRMGSNRAWQSVADRLPVYRNGCCAGHIQ